MMLFLQGRSILPVRRPNGAENKTVMLIPFLSKGRLRKLYTVITSHYKPVDKMHHRIKDIQAIHLVTNVLLNTVWNTGKLPCASKSAYNNTSSHHKDKKKSQ